QHGGEHEAAHDPPQPLVVVALVKDIEQEVNEAADHGHDQRRANGDGDVIGGGLVEAVWHRPHAVYRISFPSSAWERTLRSSASRLPRASKQSFGLTVPKQSLGTRIRTRLRHGTRIRH